MPKTITDELRNLRGLCEPGCYGRCRVCPAEVVERAIIEIDRLRTRLADAEQTIQDIHMRSFEPPPVLAIGRLL